MLSRSARRFAPSLGVIDGALLALEKYGIPAPDETADVWSQLLRHAAAHPIRAYAIAAGHAKEAVCVKISTYTLGASLTEVSEADALTMVRPPFLLLLCSPGDIKPSVLDDQGPLYLRRLFFLHVGRAQACKRVIDKPPRAHQPMPSCPPVDALKVLRAWDLAVANIIVRPSLQDISPRELRDEFGPVVRGRTCPECVESVRARVDEAVADWQAIKMTI